MIARAPAAPSDRASETDLAAAIRLPGAAIRTARTAADWEAVFEVRRRVFRDELAIVDASVTDGEDRRGVTLLVTLPAGAIGAGRLTLPTVTRRSASIAWVAVLPAFRGFGAGAALMRALLAAADRAGMPAVTLSARAAAIPFYRQFGFLPYDDRFLVGGVEHQMMLRRHLR